MSDKSHDVPFDECVKLAATYILAGATVHQKWTCHFCKEWKTMDIPNKFYEKGKCDDCGHVTNIRKRGCGFLLMFGV